MSIEIKRLDDIEPAQATSTIIYGHSGSGKTTFLGSGGSRWAIIDNGKNVDALLSPYFKATHPNKSPLIVTVKGDWEKEFETPVILDMIGDAIDELFAKHKDDFDGLAIDDVTSLRMAAMYKGLTEGKEIGRSKTKDNIKNKKLDSVILDPGDYFIEQNLILQFITGHLQMCRSNNKHFMMAAHVRETYGKPAKLGDEAPLLYVGPGFSGKTFPDDVVGRFDNCWYFENVGGTSYRMITQGNDRLTANTSMGGVLEVTEKNPNLEDIMNRLQSAKALVKKK